MSIKILDELKAIHKAMLECSTFKESVLAKEKVKVVYGLDTVLEILVIFYYLAIGHEVPEWLKERHNVEGIKTVFFGGR